jgi:hypothetical protein
MFLRWWKKKPRLQKLRYHWKTEIPIVNKGYIIPALSNQSRVQDLSFSFRFIWYFVQIHFKSTVYSIIQTRCCKLQLSKGNCMERMGKKLSWKSSIIFIVNTLEILAVFNCEIEGQISLLTTHCWVNKSGTY